LIAFCPITQILSGTAFLILPWHLKKYNNQAWYAEFLLEINLKFFLEKQEQDGTSRLHLYLCILTNKL
jgi:hypothetical protein